MIQIFTITVNHEKQKLWDKWINQAGKDKQTWRVKVITNKLAINGMCLCVYLCFTCLTWAVETGHRPSASDRHFKPLLPSPPCGLADNGNLIGGSTERVVVEVVLRGGYVVRLLWETLQSAGPPICPVELFVTVSSTVILPLLFLGRAIIAPIPLTYPWALCAGTGSGFNSPPPPMFDCLPPLRMLFVKSNG